MKVYSELPSWAKGVVVVGGLTVTYLAVTSVLRKLKEAKNKKESLSEINASSSELQDEINKGKRPTLSKTQLEAMANADYLESAVYILLLFKEHSRRIFDCPTRYHVNFKSLCNFFDINRRSYIGIDEIVKKLIEKDILSSKNLKMLLDMVKEEVENSGNTDCFKMTDVLPTPELQELAKITDAKQVKEETIEEL
jgi:hypothetical protein